MYVEITQDTVIMKKKYFKFDLISDLEIFQVISLFKAVSAKLADTFSPFTENKIILDNCLEILFFPF